MPGAGDKMMTLAASALAGGDCIDDADVWRTGGTARTMGGVGKAPSTLGTFLRSFVGRCPPTGPGEPRVLARAWTAGAGPGDAPLTIDLDSTICETYVLAKEGRATMAPPASAAITGCRPWPPEPARC